jgi:hypothetical protein
VKLAKLVLIIALIVLPFFLYHLPAPGSPASGTPAYPLLNELLAVIAAGTLGGLVYFFTGRRPGKNSFPISRLPVHTAFTLIFYALFYRVFLYLRCGFPGPGPVFIAAAAAIIGFFSRRLIESTAKIMDALLKTDKNDENEKNTEENHERKVTG